MANRNYKTDLFDAYLTGELEGVELQLFNERLRADLAFAKAFEEHKDLIKGIQYAEEKKIRETLSFVKNDLAEEGFFAEKEELKWSDAPKFEAKIISFRRLLAYAAGGLILLGASFFILKNQNSSMTQQELFAEFYQPEKTALFEVLDRLEAQGFSSETEEESLQLSNVLKLYESGEFSATRSELSKFFETYPGNKTASFYLGLTLLELDEFSIAAARLTSLSIDPNFEFSKEAAWYAALAYGQFETPEGKENTRRLMQKIAADKNSDFAEKAKEYLKRSN